MPGPAMRATTPPSAPPGARRDSRRRELAAATVGSVVESFDWNIYAVLAPFFAAQMFGSGGAGGLLAAYAGFAVGFVARPLGSALIGRLSDTRGRRFGLTVAMAGIAAASLVVAVIPGSATLGVWAGVLVVAARLAQGLAYGGETPTVAAYVTETAPPRRRFLFSSISYGGIIVGTLLSYATMAVMYAVLGKDGLADGGWRWGFVAAAVIGLAALWVRRAAPESEEFERAAEERGAERSPLATVFRDHRTSVASLFLFVIGGTVAFYFALVYLPVYAGTLKVTTNEHASSFMTVVLLITLASMLVSGWAADRWGVLRVLRAGYGGLFVLTVPLAVAMRDHVLPFEVVAVVFGILTAPGLAATNVLSGLLFPTSVRAVGTGVVGAATIAAFGGTFPMLAEALTGAGLINTIPWYVAACMACAVASTFVAARVPGLKAQTH
ncbi:MFS transporter [Streptomyces sp. NPDC002523]